MLPELTEIKILRKKFKMTQERLSAKSGVSQGMIAKIEKGKVVPSYDKAKRIFSILENEGRKKSLYAIDIATKKIVFIKDTDKPEKAIKLMQKKGISQLPVLSGGIVIGILTERSALEYLKEGKKKGLKVKDLTEERFAVLPEKTDIDTVSRLLSENIQTVLLSRKEKITGIIARADLLKSALKMSK